MRFGERPALGERGREHLARGGVLGREVQREPRVALGVGHAADTQRELRRAAGGHDPQPDRTAPDGLVLQRLDRGRRVAVVGQHQRARGQHVRGAVLRLVEEQVAVERPQGEGRALGCGRRSQFDARPCAVGEDDAAQQRVRGLQGRDATRVLGGARQARVERRDLDRQAGVRVGLRRQFAVEVPGVGQVERGEARQHVDARRRRRRVPACRRRPASGRPASNAAWASRVSSAGRSSPGARSWSARWR